MDNKKWNTCVCAETLDYYERKNAWGCCLILIWIQLFIVYILNHVKQHNEVYLENISKRLQLLREPSWTTGCCSFIPSTWHYNHFWIFLPVIISSNEITASFPPITSFFLCFISYINPLILLIIIFHRKKNSRNMKDTGFQIPLLLLLVEKQVSKHKDKINTATVKQLGRSLYFLP